MGVLKRTKFTIEFLTKLGEAFGQDTEAAVLWVVKNVKGRPITPRRGGRVGKTPAGTPAADWPSWPGKPGAGQDGAAVRSGRGYHR